VNAQALLMAGLEALSRRQLLTGELPARTSGSACSSPLLCSLAHDALGYLDPASPMLTPNVLDLVPVAKRRWFSAAIMTLRWRLRTYLAWQEESDGTWRRFGRQSGEPSDGMTTACAAMTLASRAGNTHTRHLRALASFRNADGIFCRRAGPHETPDPTTNAHALRLLVFSGEPLEPVLSYVIEQLQHGELALSHATARAVRQGAIPVSPSVYDTLAGVALRPSRPRSLHSALTALTLLDAGFRGPELAGLADELTSWRQFPNDILDEEYAGAGAASTEVTLALYLCALVRLAAISGAKAA
jgi:hypothetical protein